MSVYRIAKNVARAIRYRMVYAAQDLTVVKSVGRDQGSLSEDSLQVGLANNTEDYIFARYYGDLAATVRRACTADVKSLADAMEEPGMAIYSHMRTTHSQI
jgi:hypothetical protein